MRLTRNEIQERYNEEIAWIEQRCIQDPSWRGHARGMALAGACRWRDHQINIALPDDAESTVLQHTSKDITATKQETNKMSLGQKLSNNIADQVRKASEAAEAGLRTAERVENARVSAISNKLAEYRVQIADAIENGLMFNPVRVPTEWRSYGVLHGDTLDNPNHPDHALWLYFAEWATSEELAAKLVYQHDGIGMSSWYTLTVTPLV